MIIETRQGEKEKYNEITSEVNQLINKLIRKNPGKFHGGKFKKQTKKSSFFTKKNKEFFKFFNQI